VEGKRAGTMANTPPGKPCKTKPISEGVSSEAVGAGSCAWPSGGRPPGAAPTHVTLQTLGGTPTAQGQSCQTNPNCGSPRGTGTLPVSQDHGQDGDPKGDSSRLGTPAHATTSAVFCQTKPIGSLGERQVLCSPEVTKDSPQGGTGRAKPQEAGYRPVHCVGRPAVRS
jgi:hypothetical protein